MAYDTGEETFNIDVGTIEVAGDLAVWNVGDYVVVAGGAYPPRASRRRRPRSSPRPSA